MYNTNNVLYRKKNFVGYFTHPVYENSPSAVASVRAGSTAAAAAKAPHGSNVEPTAATSAAAAAATAAWCCLCSNVSACGFRPPGVTCKMSNARYQWQPVRYVNARWTRMSKPVADACVSQRYYCSLHVCLASEHANSWLK